MRTSLVCGLVCSVLGTYEAASAATIYLRDVDNTPTGSLTSTFYDFNGNIVTNAVFDDGTMLFNNHQNQGDSQSMQIRNINTGVFTHGALAVKDLFSIVPTTSGGNAIEITSATLHLAAGGAYGARTLNVTPIKTDWLANAAGNNERRFSALRRNGVNLGNTAADDQTWASGAFGSADLDTTVTGSGTFFSTTYGQFSSFDITAAVTKMYATGINYGFLIALSVSTDTGFYNIRSSNDTLDAPSGDTFRPVLEITYTYVPEPATIGIAGLAAAGLLGRRRRERLLSA